MKKPVTKHWRIRFIFALQLLGLCGVIGKLVYVQLIKGDTLEVLSQRQSYRQTSTTAYRGEIVDRQGITLALSVPAVSIYAHPQKLTLQDQQTICQALQQAKLKQGCKKLKSSAPFVWLARQLKTENYSELIAAIKPIEGAGIVQGAVRVYPKGVLAGQLLGFVGIDGRGLEGLEKSMDDMLQLQPKTVRTFQDARKHFIVNPEDVVAMLPEQQNVQLTIDTNYQALLEKALADAVEQFGGQAAVGLLAEAKTGAIRAAAVAPSFNPNEFSKYKPAQWRARFVTDAFEPGSTMKPLIYGTALSLGHRSTELFYAEMGKMRVDQHDITDDEPMGWLTMRQVVVESSNVGAAKIGFAIGKEAIFKAYQQFGFGRVVGVQLPSESKGILRSPQQWSKLDWATLSFGQGLSASPMQLLNAYLMVANDGQHIQPHFVERVYRVADGGVVWQFENQPEETFVDKAVFQEIRSVLKDVVEVGTGQQAKVEGLSVGGKTGTAQKPDLVGGGYKKGAYIAWFAGMFPLEDPKWVAVVLVDEPEKNIYGGAVAAPVFRRLAQMIAIEDGLLNLAAINQSKNVDIAKLPTSNKEIQALSIDHMVPDLSGLSLREVGQWAQAYGVGVKPNGYGRVVKQKPAAGTPTKPGQVWQIELAQQTL